jgi:putative FmdB family regulatory protein
MPLYEWVCEKDGLLYEELRKVGDFTPPFCEACGQPMQKIITPVNFILNGQGWTYGSQEKIKRRSEDQSKKFFRRHPDKQAMTTEKIQEQRKLE